MRRRELLTLLTATAEPIYGAREAEQIAKMILSEVASITPTQLILEPDVECNIENLDTIIEELSASRPVQYIIGSADFCGYSFIVSEGVLIPRPETEELIFRIVEEATSSARILDVGCGSGAIAISLAKLLPNADITALDISDKALEITTKNAENLGAKITIIEGDALEGVENYTNGEFDVIVSNPPYIPWSEAQEMRGNVLDYEPDIALFVEDDDPLIFYRAIAKSAQKLLRSEGLLYFEIHENFATETRDMLHQMGYIGIAILNDINNKPRIVCAERR